MSLYNEAFLWIVSKLEDDELTIVEISKLGSFGAKAGDFGTKNDRGTPLLLWYFSLYEIQSNLSALCLWSSRLSHASISYLYMH